MNTRKMHAWVHYYPNPGDHDDMHCHNEDQTFICFEGQCTMHFPDGGKAVLRPGMAALIRFFYVVLFTAAAIRWPCSSASKRTSRSVTKSAVGAKSALPTATVRSLA